MSTVLLEGVAEIVRFRPSRVKIMETARTLGVTPREAEIYLQGIWGGAGFVDSLEIAILDHVMGNASHTPNAQNFVALSSTTPTEAAGNFTEPSSGSYARVETEGTGANGPAWGAASGTAPVSLSNSEAITFPQATADWVSGANLTHFGIFSASSGGSVQIWGALTTAKPVLNGDTASFAASAIVIKLGDPGDSY